MSRLDLNRELANIDASGRRHAAWVSTMFLGRAMRAWKAGRSRFDTHDLERRIGDVVTRACCAAHLKGHARAKSFRPISAASRETKRILNRASTRDKEALSKFYGAIARSTVSKTMSQVRDSLVLQLDASVRSGTSPKADLNKSLKRLGFGRGSDNLVDSIVRTQTAMAFNAAAWVEADDPMLWGFTYVTAGDERVRESHQVLDGVTLPKEDTWWKLYAPPNGWRCRCGLQPLYEPTEIVRFEGTPEVDPAFKFNPASLF